MQSYEMKLYSCSNELVIKYTDYCGWLCRGKSKGYIRNYLYITVYNAEQTI